MDREVVIRLWEEAWSEGLWYATWEKALDGLSPAQAAWKPYPERHSIWQILNHMLFWQDYSLRLIAGNKPSREEAERGNWLDPAEVSQSAWADARRRFAGSCQKMRDAMNTADEEGFERLIYHLPHESYHFGQIMYLRALQGLAPIE